MSDIGKLVGEKIRSVRKQRGMSQEKLGQLSDLHPKYISTIERAEKNVSLDSIEKIITALDLNLEEFFRNIQPSSKSHDEFAVKLYNLIINMKTQDQKFLADQLEAIISWKNSKDA